MKHQNSVIGAAAFLSLVSISGLYMLIGGIGVVIGAMVSVYTNFKLLDRTQTL